MSPTQPKHNAVFRKVLFGLLEFCLIEKNKLKIRKNLEIRQFECIGIAFLDKYVWTVWTGFIIIK